MLKLAHVLVDSVHEIETRLYSILYAFIKSSETTDINALFEHLKTLTTNHSIEPNSALGRVLVDMNDKTVNDSLIIDSVGRKSGEAN